MLSFANTKLKRDGIASFSLPAGKTCPGKGECAKGCYAMSGFFLMPSVKKAYEANWAATNSDTFVAEMVSEIIKKKALVIRIHASGDFYSLIYLNKWLAIVQACPSVKFYAYTKMIPLFRGRPLPDNFTVIFSEGGKWDDQIDTASDRHARVFPTLAALKRAKYADVTTNDIRATGKNPRIGLVYHGSELKAWATGA
jgi:hypothetical protein